MTQNMNESGRFLSSGPTGGPDRRVRRTVAAAAVWLALLVAGRTETAAADLRDVLTEYTVTSWAQKDGLPPGAIWSTAQDEDGYLWIATDAGLYRFDGARFVQWAPSASPGLPHVSVRVVHVAGDGSIWAGHGEPGGISQISRGHVRAYGERDGLPQGAITVILENSRGEMWAGSSQGLFAKVDDRWEKVRAPGIPDAPVFGAYLNPRDDLTIGTGAGIFRRDAGSKTFTRVDLEYQGVPRSLSEDAQGHLFVVDGIVGVREAGANAANIPVSQRGRGYRLLHDRRGNLWVGTLGQGLWRMSTQQQARRTGFERATALTGLAYDGVLSLTEDRQGNVWAGTSEGLSRLVPRKITQITDLGLVTGVDVDRGGQVWVGTVDELMRFSDSNLQGPIARVPLRSTQLRTMHIDRDTLWAATDDYVGSLSGTGATLARVGENAPFNRVDVMTTDLGGNLWLYDNHGQLRRWSRGRLESVVLPGDFEGHRILKMFGDRSGRLWTSLDNGRIGFLADGHFTMFAANDGYEAGASRAFYEDRDGAIWIAGTAGLGRFWNGKFSSLTERTGFPFDNLTAVIDDQEQNLWIGSSVGIMRLGRGEFDKALNDRQYTLQYALYDRSDGIAGTPLAQYSTGRPATRAGDGRLWFVTGLGLTVIDPQALAAPVTQRPVRIEQVMADEAPLAVQPGMSLPPRTSRLQIDYTVVNLTSPFRTNFKYRLEGFDSGWIDAGTRRQAFYTNLPPRKYRFSLVASNSEGAELSSTNWDFSIAPMFYQTAWFYAASVTALVLALWGAWYLHLRRVRRDFALLLGERTRLSREIHDTLLQSLVGVALQFEAIAGDVESASPDTKAQFIRMRKRVEEYIREARQSIWNLRSPRLERRDLAAALTEFGEQASASSGVGFELVVEGTTPRPRPPAVEEQLLRIGQEAIMNAVRHARARLIKVELKFGDDALVLRVTDDGAGFNVEAQSNELSGHYGLISMKERAGEAGGTLNVASSVDAGTQVTFVLPMSRQSWKPSHADA